MFYNSPCLKDMTTILYYNTLLRRFSQKKLLLWERELFYVPWCSVYIIHFNINGVRPYDIHKNFHLLLYDWVYQLEAHHHRIIATSYSSHIIECDNFMSWQPRKMLCFQSNNIIATIYMFSLCYKDDSTRKICHSYNSKEFVNRRDLSCFLASLKNQKIVLLLVLTFTQISVFFLQLSASKVQAGKNHKGCYLNSILVLSVCLVVS